MIIGRCADYVLRDFPGCVNVFICADKKERIARIAERYGLTERKAAERVRKMATGRDVIIMKSIQGWTGEALSLIRHC